MDAPTTIMFKTAVTNLWSGYSVRWKFQASLFRGERPHGGQMGIIPGDCNEDGVKMCRGGSPTRNLYSLVVHPHG